MPRPTQRMSREHPVPRRLIQHVTQTHHTAPYGLPSSSSMPVRAVSPCSSVKSKRKGVTVM